MDTISESDVEKQQLRSNDSDSVNTDSLKKRKILVTGATGFLGTNVLRALASNSSVQIVAACRKREKLQGYSGETRIGDLTDAAYRKSVVQDVDVVCHLGTWSSFWGHAKKETSHFYEPCLDLIEQAINAGVKRFLLPSTVAIAQKSKNGAPIDDFSNTAHTGFWPHLDRLVDVDRYMQANCDRGMQMVTLRLGHFLGAGNTLGLVPALVPRLRTFLVPWLAGGKKRLAVVSDADLTQGIVKAILNDNLNNYESFNICGAEFPALREVFTYIADHSNSPKPWYSVPYFAGYAFGWLMESLFPVLPGSSPFLTRSLVHVAEDWYCPSDYAKQKIGYEPSKDWRSAIDESLEELESKGFPWPKLAQS